jgi:hypothetical protein
MSSRPAWGRRLLTSTLIVFAVWVAVFFTAVIRSRAHSASPRITTDVEIHSGQIRLGYDLLSLAAAAVAVAVWRWRKGGRGSDILPEMAGAVVAVVLAIGMVYYSVSLLDRFLPRPFAGEDWAMKSAAAYAAGVLSLLAVASVISKRKPPKVQQVV